MSEFTETTITIVLESTDGDSLDGDTLAPAINRALADVAKVRGWKGGDHLIARVAIAKMLDAAKDAARFVGLDPDQPREPDAALEFLRSRAATFDSRGVCEECEDSGCKPDSPLCLAMSLRGWLNENL